MLRNFVFAGAAAAALIAVPALAQQSSARPNAQPLTRAAFETAVQARFARADANGDGFITREEVQAGAAERRNARVAKQGQRRGKRFARLDANRDGSISRAEFESRDVRAGTAAQQRANRTERRSDRMERRMARKDNRGAGMGIGQGFARLDTNRDNRISLAEMTAARLARFERIDNNRDGVLSIEERRAARQATRQARTNG